MVVLIMKIGMTRAEPKGEDGKNGDETNARKLRGKHNEDMKNV